MTETRDKIMQYKSKMVDEAELRRRLASLEESVDLHEHMKRQVTSGIQYFILVAFSCKININCTTVVMCVSGVSRV